MLNCLNSTEDDRDPCEGPINGILCIGCNDKTGIQIGNDIPLEAVSKQSNPAMVSSDAEVVAGDHDYGFAKLTPSVAYHMNQSTNPGDSFYSGGENGTGCTFVALHDAVLDPSSGLKHAVHYFQLLQLLAQETSSK
eukprot:5033133-Ditylum_brightwellii.AAC.1